MYEIAILQLASVAAQAGLNMTWSETPEDTFSYDEAQMYIKGTEVDLCVKRST